MLTYLLIYLLPGIILNLTGPLANQIRNEMKDRRRQTVPLDELKARKQRLLYAEIIFRSLVLLIYPVAFALWFRDKYKYKKSASEMNEKHRRVRHEIEKEMERKKWEVIENRSFIYFSDTQGEGIIKCHGCGFKQDIVGLTGNRDDSKRLSKGYQCQKCGRFHNVHFLGGKSISPFIKCLCGGELSNMNPIFCPQCRTRDVFFECECFT